MTIEYINRRNQTYYLHAETTKTDKPKYFFLMKAEGDLVEAMLEGYEIYENPNAQVFLRKIQPQITTPEEVAIARLQGLPWAIWEWPTSLRASMGSLPSTGSNY